MADPVNKYIFRKNKYHTVAKYLLFIIFKINKNSQEIVIILILNRCSLAKYSRLFGYSAQLRSLYHQSIF